MKIRAILDDTSIIDLSAMIDQQLQHVKSNVYKTVNGIEIRTNYKEDDMVGSLVMSDDMSNLDLIREIVEVTGGWWKYEEESWEHVEAEFGVGGYCE